MTLHAGAAVVDITPPLGAMMRNGKQADAVHDPLCVWAFTIERGDAGLALIVANLPGIQRIDQDKAKERLAATIGSPQERVLICCTRTHTGALVDGPFYPDFLVGRIADAVRLAWQSRKLASAGWGAATEDRIAFNRRDRIADGTVQTNPRGTNPGKFVARREDLIVPAGPTDPDLGILALRRAASGTIGVFGNFACHYAGTPHGPEIVPAGQYAYVAEMLQRLRAERLVAALSFGNGGRRQQRRCPGRGPAGE